MKGYTDGLKVGEHLGRTLSNDEYAHVDELVPAVEAYIDRVTGRSWLDATPITDEPYPVYGPRLYLKRCPVLAITAIVGAAWSGVPAVPLAPTSYSLIDAERGLVWLPAVYGYAVVSYTHAGPPLPADLALAATQLCAHWLGSGGGGEDGLSADIKAYSVGQELTVTRFDSAAPGVAAIPAEVEHIVRGYARASVVFA